MFFTLDITTKNDIILYKEDVLRRQLMNDNILKELVRNVNLENSLTLVSFEWKGVKCNNVNINRAVIDKGVLTLTGDPIIFTDVTSLLIDLKDVLSLNYEDSNEKYVFNIKDNNNSFFLYIEKVEL